jgi:histidyl-tRNA synthetase
MWFGVDCLLQLVTMEVFEMGSNMSPQIRALRGTDDILTYDVQQWTWVESQCRAVCQRFGFQEVRTPLIEEAALFTRSVGAATDIVQKEMYAFTDAGDRHIALRPEATASIVRAYVQHEIAKQEGLAKWSYLGPMFRAERPQAGRKRQFHQIGVEAIGSSHPLIDAEVILLAIAVLESIGITGTRLRINNVGSKADRAQASRRLREQLMPCQRDLCTDCQSRLERNVFRILDCKSAGCRSVVQKLQVDLQPGEASQAHYGAVVGELRTAGVALDEDPLLVRGLDYYTNTVFELAHASLGAHDALGAGGRYDTLVSDLGGPDVGACGFALGLERMLMVLATTATEIPGTSVGVICIAAAAADQQSVFHLMHSLRLAGIAASMDFESRSMKAQLRWANKSGARFALIVGERERQDETVTLKDLMQSTQETIPRAAMITTIQERVQT